MQEKTAKDVCRLSCRNENELTIFQAMTKIEDVFKISINDVLDYNMLRKICLTGHSRVPVYEEVELPNANGKKVQRILGVLLVKHCVLLDPEGKLRHLSTSMMS